MDRLLDTCFHHTDRPTGRRCSRCGRPACPDCLRDAPVGAQCWQCVREGAATTARPVPSLRTRLAGERILVTKTLIAVNVAAFLLMASQDGSLSGDGPAQLRWALFGPAVEAGEWWRIATSGFVHYGVLHIAFNMLILWQVGLLLEPIAGRARFATIYFVSLLAGSFGALLAAPLSATGGASGAVFGVVGAAVLLMHRRGMGFWSTGWGPLLVINLVLTFVVPGISIGGHLGGLVGGLLVGAVLLRPLRPAALAGGYAVAAAVGAVAVAGCFWAAAQPGPFG